MVACATRIPNRRVPHAHTLALLILGLRANSPELNSARGPRLPAEDRRSPANSRPGTRCSS